MAQSLRQGRYRLTVTDDGQVDPAILGRLLECWQSSYSKMARRFNPGAASLVTLQVDPQFAGAGETVGAHIRIGAAYLSTHPWDCDVMTHEQFHVVQAYGSVDYPVWAMEGLADFARAKYGLYNQQSGWSLGSFATTQHYIDSYRVTARFFTWLQKRRPFVDQLDARMRSGIYRDSFWHEVCGRTVDQLWADYSASPVL